jgi:hypothetical protein
MFILLFIIFGLMLWSVRLMFTAFRQSDFSLLFAGTLVALSSAGIVTVYSLMNGCMGYLSSSETIASSNLGNEGYSMDRSFSAADESALWMEDFPIIETNP